MKALSGVAASIVAILLLLSAAYERSLLPAPGYEADVINMGIPLQNYYPEGVPARTVWGMQYFDGKLFISCGDFDTNAGPVPITHYDFSSQTWIQSEPVPDEQIQDFHVIGNTLMTPGLDPQDDWSLGNYYYYQNGQWMTQRTIPVGIHQFDMIEQDDRLFVAIGTAANAFPIVASDDGGITFQNIPMYKSGSLIDTSTLPGYPDSKSLQNRCYDFFTHNGQLYALYFGYFDQGYLIEIYKYQDGAFYYHSSMPRDLRYNRINYEFITGKAEYQGNVYFSTGNFYRTSDLLTAKQISLPEHAVASDLQVFHDRLYASVCQKTENGHYRNALWVASKDDPDKFTELFYFYFTCPIQCFSYHDSNFYFGMGDGILSDHNEKNGTVLSVPYRIP